MIARLIRFVAGPDVSRANRELREIVGVLMVFVLTMLALAIGLCAVVIGMDWLARATR